MYYRKFQNGDAVKVSIMINDVVEDFSLALCKEKGYLNRFALIFVAKEGAFTTGLFSGGLTGGGASDIRPKEEFDKTYELLTFDLVEINYFMARKAEEERLAHKQWIASMREKVIKLNDRPEQINFPNQIGEFVMAERTAASFDPGYSRSIQGGKYHLRHKGTGARIYLERYKSKDGKLLVKNFCSDAQYTPLNELVQQMDPRVLLETLFSMDKDINKDWKGGY